MQAREPTKPNEQGRLTIAIRYVLLLLVMGLAVHLLLPQLATFQKSLSVLRGLAWWAVLLAFASQVMSYMGSGYLLSTLASVGGQGFGLLRGAMIYTAAASVGLVAGGSMANATVTYRWARGCGATSDEALLAAWLPAPFATATLLVAAIFGLVHLLIAHQLSVLQIVGFSFTLVTLGASALIGLWGFRKRDQLAELVARLAQRWAKIRRHKYDRADTDAALTGFFSAWDSLRSRGWRKPLLGAAMNTGFDMLTLFFIFLAAGHPLTLGGLLVGYGLPFLLSRITFLPGGVGIVESTMVALYSGLGVPNEVTVVVVLSYRFLSFWLPLLLGFPMAAILQRHCGKAGEPAPKRADP